MIHTLTKDTEDRWINTRRTIAGITFAYELDDEEDRLRISFDEPLKYRGVSGHDMFEDVDNPCKTTAKEVAEVIGLETFKEFLNIICDSKVPSCGAHKRMESCTVSGLFLHTFVWGSAFRGGSRKDWSRVHDKIRNRYQYGTYLHLPAEYNIQFSPYTIPWQSQFELL
jgi:hypothetical protein